MSINKKTGFNIRYRIALSVIGFTLASLALLLYVSRRILLSDELVNQDIMALFAVLFSLHSLFLLVLLFWLLRKVAAAYVSYFNRVIETHLGGDIRLEAAGSVTTLDQAFDTVLERMLSSLKRTNAYAEELAISNEQLQRANEIIEKTTIVVFEWTLVPGIPVKFVTNNIAQFGYTAEEFYSGAVDYWDFVYEEDLEKTQNTVWNNRKLPISEYKHTYRIKCKNGDIRWVEEWTLLERDGGGSLVSEKGILRDISDQVEAAEKINYLSVHDKLTALYNRAYFDEFLKKLDESRAFPFSVIIGDVNGLKLANDAFGHEAGDHLLRMVARILEKACRKTDVVARTGGDEFAIVLPGTTDEEAVSVCSRIKQLCSDAEYAPIQPSIALGYATKTHCGQTIDEFTKRVDNMMYRNKLNESLLITNAVIDYLQSTLEKKSVETRAHSQRLKALALGLGELAGLTEGKLDELAIAAEMHDIGKIAVPEETLLKNGGLDQKEWEAVKKHSEIGYHIVLSSLKMASIAEYILSHHERWDGTGYPRQIKGEDIPLASRIISIADAYDVMTHNKPYSRAVTREEAVEELKRCAGSQFDPRLVDIFVEMMDKA